MFSYCKRTNQSVQTRDFPINYQMSNLHTVEGFNKRPFMCTGLNVPAMPMKQVPLGLYDVEATLRGRNREEQVFCQNEKRAELPQYAFFRPMPVPGKAPIPIAPTIQTSGMRNDSLCRHVTMTTPCGDSCACDHRCSCRATWTQLNQVPFRAGPPPMASNACDSIRF